MPATATATAHPISHPLAPAKSAPSSIPQTHLHTPPQSLHTATTTTAVSTAVDTHSHISNLERVLHKSTPSLLSNNNQDQDHPKPPSFSGAGNLIHALNLSTLFSFRKSDDISPRSLAHLQRLLSTTTRPSPKPSISSRWRLLHGSNNWSNLLNPLDQNLRQELLHYGDLVQAAYHTFHSNPAASPSRHRHIILPDRNYRATRSLFASTSIEIPAWLDPSPPWMTQQSSWIGFVAVCDNDREIARMGRRDIVVSLRGTATALEWAENLRATLKPIPNSESAKVSSGFLSLYKSTPNQPNIQSLSASVIDEIRRLLDKYAGEELSITITGHSLGAALALLIADELSDEIENSPPIAVVSFGGPRVGNKAFAERVEGKGVKVLRVVNTRDMITRVPAGLVKGKWWGSHVEGGYVHVGTELRVDNRSSPYLKPDADPACCHDLEAYLHLVDGFMGTDCPFRCNAKRSLARLLTQQRPNVKKIYVSRARSLGAVEPGCGDVGVHHGFVSPSG